MRPIRARHIYTEANYHVFVAIDDLSVIVKIVIMIATFGLQKCANQQIKPIFAIAQRFFMPKSYPMFDGTHRGEAPRRYGYEPHHHTQGLLPRLKKKEKMLSSKPVTSVEDPWSKRQARKGENDFIKILGDPDYEQHDLLTHIPDWLRGYKNTNREYSVLMRKRKEFEDWQYTKPTKWLHLEQRIKFLYRRINNKYKPPEVEQLNRSRHLL